MKYKCKSDSMHIQRDILKVYKGLTILQTRCDLMLIKLVFIKRKVAFW